jgi:hypothetical protein
MIAKKHIQTLHALLRALDNEEAARQKTGIPAPKGSIRTLKIREAEALRTALPLLASGRSDPDATRYRRFFDAGLPITFMGIEYHDKASLDAAIDADIAQEGKAS